MVDGLKTGIQLHPQHTTMAGLRQAWRAADEVADSLWLWDHFFPLYGDPDGGHFEGWTSLAAMAADTSRATVGLLVTCGSYRNPDLLADMARTVDHLSGGRCVLGLGAGWFQRDYDAYGYDFGTAPRRLAALGEMLPRIRARLDRLNPPPLSAGLPILIGGGGEKVTLRLVAEHATMWNYFTPTETFARKNALLDEWCERVGRDPAAVERTIAIREEEVEQAGEFVEAGATHVIVSCAAPFDLGPAHRLREVLGLA